MQELTSKADELVEQIDNNEVDPAEVDVTPFAESDGDPVFTPELAERLPDEKVEEYNQRAAARQHNELASEARDVKSKHEEALDLLGPEEDDQTTHITLGSEDVELEVRTYMDAWVEDEVETIFDETEDRATYRERIPQVMAWFIRDDEYGEAELWREYAKRYGVSELVLRFMETVEPVLERQEESDVVERFRSRARQSNLDAPDL